MADPGDLTCQELVELVTDYLEGALSPEEARRFAAHLDDCDSCLDYLAQMRQMIAALGRLGEADVAPAARTRLLATFRDWKRATGTTPAP